MLFHANIAVNEVPKVNEVQQSALQSTKNPQYSYAISQKHMYITKKNTYDP